MLRNSDLLCSVGMSFSSSHAMHPGTCRPCKQENSTLAHKSTQWGNYINWLQKPSTVTGCPLKLQQGLVTPNSCSSTYINLLVPLHDEKNKGKLWSSKAEDVACHVVGRGNELLRSLHWNACQWYLSSGLPQEEKPSKFGSRSKMKSKACRWKIKPPYFTPPLNFYRTFSFFYWATWKCFMGNLRDTGGYHLWSRVWTLDSSNTSPVSLSLGKTDNLPLIRAIAVLSVPSVSGGWGADYASIAHCSTVQHKSHHTCHMLAKVWPYCGEAELMLIKLLHVIIFTDFCFSLK